MNRMKDKVAIVTGGANGMGEAFVRLFVGEGAKVVITDLDATKGEKLQAELGANTLFVKQDVSSESDWVNVIAATEKQFGNVDVLVNNAGIAIMKDLKDYTEAEYMKIIKVNQVSVYLGMQKAVESMRKAGGGSIINISSIGGLVGMPSSIAYGASKFAVRGMTKMIALELAQENIRVNSVHPGLIATDIIKDIPEADMKANLANIPMGRFGNPDEIGHLVVFLASDESSYCTGAEFIADGGYSMR